MKATAIAPANIAFIKYWGKKDPELRLPLNDSISMNLSNCLTTTTVEFSDKYQEDYFELLPYNHRKKLLEHNFAVNNEEKKRVIKHLNRIRKSAKLKCFAKIVSQNNFPASVGIASSASGFAALTVAGCAALNVDISEKELTILARIGSGSACRSIPDGFVEWKFGESSETSFAYSLYPNNYWNLRDLVVLVANQAKKVATSEGMGNVWSSPLMKKRIENVNNRIKKIKKALKDKDLSMLGEMIEEETDEMHEVMQTQKPSLIYRTKETLKIMQDVQSWRKEGLEVYYTIDAGPNVHLICQEKDEEKVIVKIKEFNSGLKFIVNKPARGATLTDQHLF